MYQETQYHALFPREKIKRFGQYFTPAEIADFMAAWVCPGAETLLDPAVGNSVFFRATRRCNPACALTGWEIDPEILEFFGTVPGSRITQGDFLLSDWTAQYDAILCNPPYNRFQSVENRRAVLDIMERETGIRFSGYTNQYVLFLIKAISQMSPGGRLAFVIPSEFLNAQYGSRVKQLLLERELLRAVVYFHRVNVFAHSTTTCCILLLDRAPKREASFLSLQSLSQLAEVPPCRLEDAPAARKIPYSVLETAEKWQPLLQNSRAPSHRNTVPLKTFCTVTRGIATGDNDFFVFKPSKIAACGLPSACFQSCVCKSADVKTGFLTPETMARLAQQDKPVFLLDAQAADAPAVRAYLAQGEAQGVHKKYLTSHREPWYAVENRPPAPILISTAVRGQIRVIRNLAGARNLTAFHAVYPLAPYEKWTNLLFSCLLTPTEQALLRANRKELGNGLEKYQPGDFMEADILDFRVLSPADLQRAERLYEALPQHPESLAELDALFSQYLT